MARPAGSGTLRPGDPAPAPWLFLGSRLPRVRLRLPPLSSSSSVESSRCRTFSRSLGPGSNNCLCLRRKKELGSENSRFEGPWREPEKWRSTLEDSPTGSTQGPLTPPQTVGWLSVPERTGLHRQGRKNLHFPESSEKGEPQEMLRPLKFKSREKAHRCGASGLWSQRFPKRHFICPTALGVDTSSPFYRRDTEVLRRNSKGRPRFAGARRDLET